MNSNRLRVRILAIIAAIAAVSILTAVFASVADHDTLRWVAIFSLALAILSAGLTLWTPNLARKDDREKVGLALLAASLFFGAGAFMTLQAERVTIKTGEQRIEAERGFDLAAEKRQLVLELGVQRDLTAIDLRRRDVSGAALRGRNLPRALLNAANLQGSDLSEANLRGAVMIRSRLNGATLKKSDLRGADLSFAQLQGADIRGADLREVDGLPSAKIAGAVADRTTLWPRMSGFSPRTAGVRCVADNCGTAPTTT